MGAGFTFSIAVVAILAIGLLVVSHFGARQVAEHKARQAFLAAEAAAREAEEEPDLPFPNRAGAQQQLERENA